MTLHPALPAHTALFTPAHRTDRIVRALAGPADVVIADLEDAVAADAKESSRERLHELLAGQDLPAAGRRRLVVRINGVDSDEGAADLGLLSSLGPCARPAVMVPKAAALADLDRVAEAVPGVPVIALVETSAGVLGVEDVAGHPAVARLAVGAVDLAAELGCAADSAPVQQARAQVVLASAAQGLVPPLDSPCVDFTDAGVMAGAAGAAVRDGFGGMLCIHPRQLEHVRTAFLPSPEEVDWAQRVVAAGDGAGVVDGRMVDRPVALRARRILESSRPSTSGTPGGVG